MIVDLVTKVDTLQKKVDAPQAGKKKCLRLGVVLASL
jgi:hypothetical protein